MQSPCAFEVQLPRRELAPAPAVKHRLEQSGSRKTLTLDDINKKMSKAAQNRQSALAKQISDVKENLDKVELVRERRNSEERITASRISERIAAAEEKRLVQISSIQDHARHHNQRVSTRVAIHSTELTQEAHTRQELLDEKLKKASEKRQATIAEIKQTAAQSCLPKSTHSPHKSAGLLE